MIAPQGTAERIWGPPVKGDEPTMLVTTALGAAVQVAGELPTAVRPDDLDDPAALAAIPLPDPRTLRAGVGTDLSALFLVLAGVCLVIGAVGIANTTLVAVVERIPEIGLRRSLGACPRHIAGQVLTESALLGVLGGLIGASAGLLAVVGTAPARGWGPSSNLPRWHQSPCGTGSLPFGDGLTCLLMSGLWTVAAR